MIRLLQEFMPWDIFSARVLAAYRSYYDIPASQFWLQWEEDQVTAAISLVDGFAVFSAKEQADYEELNAFLQMQPWFRLQCAADTAEKLPFSTEWASMLVRFEEPKPDPLGCKLASDPGEVYDILKRCFTEAELQNRNDWMADLMLRWRRGTAKSWLLDGACTVSALAVTEGFAFLGAVGTLPEARGKGLAGQLLRHIAGELTGREIWLSCREQLQGFYESIGFIRAGDMLTLKREEQA